MIRTVEIFYLNNKYTLSDSDNQISSEISSFRQMIQEILLLSTSTSFFSYHRSLFCLGDNDGHFCPSLFSEKRSLDPVEQHYLPTRQVVVSGEPSVVR